MINDQEIFDQYIETVRRFVRERLIPAENDVEANDRVPPEIVDEMREMGLFGLTVPEEYGGLGMTMEEEARLMFEISYAAQPYRAAFATTIGLGSQGIVMDGTDEQKDTYLPRIASGNLICSFALTEPGTGSDAGALKTSAVRDGDDYVINGTKRYITNAPYAGLFTVFARTNKDDPGAKGVSAFIVERDAPGITIGKVDKKMGQKGTHTSDVMFDNCRVPASAIIGGPEREGQGFRTAMKVLDRGRLHLSSACVGAAERLIDEALTYALERQQFGQPIAEFQLVQAMLAESRTEAYAARCMVLDAAMKLDQGQRITTEAAACKLFCSEMVGRVADRAVQIHGGAGYIADYKVERFYRDVRLFRLYDGTSEIQKLVIARQMIRDASR